MKRCPILGQPVPSQCPRGECADCQEDWQERSALIQYGGMNLTRAQSDDLAREQMRVRLPGQCELVA